MIRSRARYLMTGDRRKTSKSGTNSPILCFGQKTTHRSSTCQKHILRDTHFRPNALKIGSGDRLIRNPEELSFRTVCNLPHFRPIFIVQEASAFAQIKKPHICVVFSVRRYMKIEGNIRGFYVEAKFHVANWGTNCPSIVKICVFTTGAFC